MTSSCSAPGPRPEQPFSIRITDFAGEPVEGAEIASGEQVLATTAKEGIGAFAIAGSEGELIALTIRCPKGYSDPKEPIVSRWLGMEGGTASLVGRCRKMNHRLVVAVRADGGPNLPILRLGRVVGATDSTGAASLMFDVEVNERLELTLSTESLAKEKVSPINPVATFELGDADDVKVFDVKLNRPKPAPKRAVAKPKGPVPI
jgi:hypothetical protein